MNTVGKILVILNFLFALIVGGFLAIDFATRQNYRVNTDQYAQELKIARIANIALTDTNTSLVSQLQGAKAEGEKLKLDNALQQAQFVQKETELDAKFKDSEQRGKLAEINFEKALAAQERMKKETEELKKVIEDREVRILNLHEKFKAEQDQRLSLDRDLKFSLERNQILIARIQELERYVSELQVGTKSDVSVQPKSPNEPNPPQKFVKGVVEKVDSTDKTLVRISLGTDHGLRVNNTLEVYRLSPNAEYVGMIRIEDAHHHTSVGRLVRQPGTGPRAVREGDVVSSSLTPRP